MSRNSLSSTSIEFASRNKSKVVLFTFWYCRCATRSKPVITTLSPGNTIPASVASTFASSVCGCSPPFKPSGDSCSRIFWASANLECAKFNLKGPFFLQTRWEHSAGSLSFASSCSTLVMLPQLKHSKPASVSFGRTSVALRTSPSIETSLPTWLLLRSLIFVLSGTLTMRISASSLHSMGRSYSRSASCADPSTGCGLSISASARAMSKFCRAW